MLIQLADFRETREEQCVIRTSRSQWFEVTDLGDISMVAMITAGKVTTLALSSIVLRHVAVVGRCVVGREHCSHPTTQRPTTATNHIQQNQNNTPNAVTGPLFS